MPPKEEANCTCQKEEIIREIEKDLAKGAVIFTEVRDMAKAESLKTDQILEQVLKTNGRVTKLEDDAFKQKIADAKKHYTPLQLVRDLIFILTAVSGIVFTVIRLLEPTPIPFTPVAPVHFEITDGKAR